MFGILLAGVSSGLGELSDSIGKKEVRARIVSFYTFGFLNLLVGAMVLIALGVLHNSFLFSLASLPTFIPRVILEIAQAHMTVKAVVQADRSDFGFVKSITIPLLLVVDLALGYTVTAPQIAGVALIFFAIFLLFYFEHFRTKAKWLLLTSAINAVVTISLYKYDIAHFNSVAAEQSIISLILLLYFFILAKRFAGENPLSFLLNPVLAIQSVSSGLANVVASYAYVYAPASVITAAMRASAVLFSIISGKFYFRERRFTLKAVLFLFIVLGIVLLTR